MFQQAANFWVHSRVKGLVQNRVLRSRVALMDIGRVGAERADDAAENDVPMHEVGLGQGQGRGACHASEEAAVPEKEGQRQQQWFQGRWVRTRGLSQRIGQTYLPWW